MEHTHSTPGVYKTSEKSGLDEAIVRVSPRFLAIKSCDGAEFFHPVDLVMDPTHWVNTPWPRRKMQIDCGKLFGVEMCYSSYHLTPLDSSWYSWYLYMVYMFGKLGS